MKKNKQTKTQRSASLKRGAKRNARLKKTQSEKHIRKAEVLAEKKTKELKRMAEELKMQEEFNKIMQSRKA